jgi:hypothetical protein
MSLTAAAKRKLGTQFINAITTIQVQEEDEAMKLTQMATMAVLAAVTVACSSPISSVANTNTTDAEHVVQTQNPPASSSTRTDSSHAKKHASQKTPTQRLGPEYKKIGSFVDFRKALLADGWQPVANSNCQALLGVDDFCNVIPETFWSSGTGYYVLHYVKDGTPLSVTLYGEIEALNEPDKSGDLGVTGWEYTTGTDFIPSDTDPTYNPAYRQDKQ